MVAEWKAYTAFTVENVAGGTNGEASHLEV